MSDKETMINELKSLIESFVDERDWKQFHSPKNLAMSISIEAAELMELFQWLSLDEAKEVMMKNFGTWKFYEFDTDPINAHREKKY